MIMKNFTTKLFSTIKICKRKWKFINLALAIAMFFAMCAFVQAQTYTGINESVTVGSYQSATNQGTIKNGTISGGMLENYLLVDNLIMNRRGLWGGGSNPSSGVVLNFGTVKNAEINGTLDSNPPLDNHLYNGSLVENLTMNVFVPNPNNVVIASPHMVSRVDNYGTIYDAVVNGGLLSNLEGRVENFTLNGTMYMSGSAAGAENIGGTIGIATVNGGELFNGRSDNHSSVIENLTVNATNKVWFNGAWVNGNGTNVENAGGKINNATLNEGKVANYRDGLIENLTMNDGIISNGGRIDQMTYIGGNYIGRYGGQIGIVGTLNIAVDATGIDWGNVGSLNITGSGQTDNLGTIGTVDVYNSGHVNNNGNAFIGAVNIHDTAPAGRGVSNNNNAIIDSVTVNRNGRVNNNDNAHINSVFLNGGGRLNNYNDASIGTADITGGGIVDNGGSAYIGALSVTDNGRINNRDNAHIGTLDIAGNGIVENGNPSNSGNPTIDNVTVSGNGRVFNILGGRIDSVSVSGNVIATAPYYIAPNSVNHSTIGTLTIDSGWAQNRGVDAHINTAYIAGGAVMNIGDALIDTAFISGNGWIFNSGDSSGWASISTANVNGGQVSNWGNAGISTLLFNGGTVENVDRINEMTYVSGTYDGYQARDYWGNVVTGTGTIGMLTVAGEVTGDNWGIVENLKFDTSGNGLLTISAFVEEPSSPLAFKRRVRASHP